MRKGRRTGRVVQARNILQLEEVIRVTLQLVEALLG